MRFAGHKYTWTKPYISVHHHWELRGPRGGIHFHVSISRNGDYGPSCGLEFHHSFDPTGGQSAPHHISCPVTGGQCWHEGTSLYAEEKIWPTVKEWLDSGDHALIFSLLESEYDSHFDRYEFNAKGTTE